MQPTPNTRFLLRGYRALKHRAAAGMVRVLTSHQDWIKLFAAWMEGTQNKPILDPRVQIGRFSYGIYERTVFMARAEDRLTIGNFCSVAEGVRFIYGNHPVDTVTTFPLRTILQERWQKNVDAVSRGPIVVGNDVWIASHSIVLSGVTVGDGAVIGAGSVVTRDVAPYSLTAGVPARHIRFRHSEDQVAKLLQIKWWDWPEETIVSRLDEFYGEVEAFTRRFGPAEKAG